MLIRTALGLREADVTDPSLYASRRTVLASMGYAVLLTRRDTLPSNGYGEQVAALCSGMNLRNAF